MFTVLVNIVMCPFSHILVATDTSFYVLVQDVSITIVRSLRSSCGRFWLGLSSEECRSVVRLGVF